MATTASGITIPGSSPTTTPATPIQDHWNNLGKSLNGRVIKEVANAAGASDYLTALAADGYTVSSTAPAWVFRLDTETVEFYDGTAWTVMARDETDSGWLGPSSYGGGYSAPNTTFESRRIGKRVYLRGQIRPTSGTIASGTSGIVLLMQSSHKPIATTRVPVTAWVAGNATEYFADVMTISTSGNITLHTASTRTSIIVDGVTYLVD